MPIRKHIVISGTGRSGTTFLVELLTHLKFDTGYAPHNVASMKNSLYRAGLEHDIREANSPYVVKTPRFCGYAEEVLNHKDIVIECLLVPIRDLYAAAESRRYAVEKAPTDIEYFLWLTNSKNKANLEEELSKELYKLILSISSSFIPIIFMRYPKIIENRMYLFTKLRPILKDITYGTFNSAFKKVVKPELVHRFGENDY